MPWLSAFRLRLAASQLRRGEIVAYPTEAVYGLGCDPMNADAVGGIFRLKGRPRHKGLILIAASFEQLRPFLRPLPQATLNNVLASWPGPVTWVLPASPTLPPWLTGPSGTVAVRVTAHEPAAALCRAFGSALTSTSANLAGRPATRSLIRVRRYFRRQPIAYATGSIGESSKPTAIFDALSGRRLR